MLEFGGRNTGLVCDLPHCRAAALHPIFAAHFQPTGHEMTRFSTAILFGLCLSLCWAVTGWAQDSEPADRCFPWQEFRDGICVAKSAPTAPLQVRAQPEPSPSRSPSPLPAPAETSAAPPPLVCPPNSHVEGGACIIDAAQPQAPPRAPITIACNDGAANEGRCLCPAGFQLVPSGTEAGSTCVRFHADNCLGGQMTIAGQCLCIGQVTMSGQVYDLEFAHGKCVPKRCPRDAPCVTAAANSDADASPKLSSTERLPAPHRSNAVSPSTYFRLMPNFLGRIHY
jgi:hypothetical protein